MSITTMNVVNGPQRKTLEYQLDRLDSILDGLADALNGAVADAVKDAVGLAVREAVSAVLAEVMNNPAIVAKLAGASAAVKPEPVVPTPVQPVSEGRMKAVWNRATGGVCSILRRVVGFTRGGVRKVANAIRTGFARVRAAVAIVSALATLAGLGRRAVLWAFVIGLLVGVGCYAGGPVVASAFGGLMAYVASLIAAAIRPIWPLVRAASAFPKLMPNGFLNR